MRTKKHKKTNKKYPWKPVKLDDHLFSPQVASVLVGIIHRLAKIENWIDQWEKYDSGWNKYRKGK